MDSSHLWSDRVVEVKSRSGWNVKVYEPLLIHRWPYYAKYPKQALAKLSQFPSNTIQSILEYIYANTPVSRTNLPAFRSCKIVDSQPFVSTYHADLIRLLRDVPTCDFAIIPRDSAKPVALHKFFLYARCSYFREKLDENPNLREISESDMCREALRMFAEYLYIGDFEPRGIVSLVDLFGAGSKYGFRDPDEIDYLATSCLRERLTKENAEEVRERARERGIQSVITLVDTFLNSE